MTEVFTNTTPTDAYRGAGRPEATHAIERMMDMLALSWGSAAPRCAGATSSPSSRRPRPTGLIYDSGDYERRSTSCSSCGDEATFERRAGRGAGARQAARPRHLDLRRDLRAGAVGGHPRDRARRPAAGRRSTVRVHPTGKVTVITGTSPHGQGHATSWSQIVETELGIPFDDVEVIHGDTAFAPYGLGTYGSRSLAVGGTAVYRAAGQVRDKATADRRAHAGGLARRPRVRRRHASASRAAPTRASRIGEVAFRAWQGFDLPEGVDPGLDETVFHDPPNFTFPFGAHGCEVEIDAETGKVEIVRLHRRGRLRQRRQPDDRRRPGARRRRPVDRPGRCTRAPSTPTRAALLTGRWSTTSCRRPARSRTSRPTAPYAVARQPAGREGHRRGRHDRGHPGGGRRGVRRARRAATSTCRCSPRRVWRAIERKGVRHDPGRVRLRAAPRPSPTRVGAAGADGERRPACWPAATR